MEGEPHGDTTARSNARCQRPARGAWPLIPPAEADRHWRRNDALAGISVELNRAGRSGNPGSAGGKRAYQPPVNGIHPYLIRGTWTDLTHAGSDRWASSHHRADRGRKSDHSWRTAPEGGATCSSPGRSLHRRRATEAYRCPPAAGTPGPVDLISDR